MVVSAVQVFTPCARNLKIWSWYDIIKLTFYISVLGKKTLKTLERISMERKITKQAVEHFFRITLVQEGSIIEGRLVAVALWYNGVRSSRLQALNG